MKRFILILIFTGIFILSVLSQSILNDGKLPKDLTITLDLGGRIQFATYYNYKITADGKVFYRERSNLPLPKPNPNNLLLTGQKKPPKPPKLKEKLSEKELKQLVLEFENSGFFEMSEHYEGDSDLKEIICINHAMSKGLSISANGKTNQVDFFLGCSYGEDSPLKRFLSLYDKVEETLKGVKKQIISNKPL